ncbi:MAG TPA: alpha/beta hydrolase [Desulfuromonadales bacterium]|nr:alpha/beta hydrolase [Desulfuromonadales bacterium]
MKKAMMLPGQSPAAGYTSPFSDHPLLFSGIRPARLLAAAIPCLTGIGYAYQSIATALDRRNFPPPGELIDVGGRRLHMQLMGSARPTVVLETGLGGMSAAWGWVQPEVARFARVVSYDRAGLGWSESVESPITAFLVARRLHRLLATAGIDGPYVLVGHSMGGFFVRVFAHLYPDEVTGVVLLDAAHPDQDSRSPAITRHMNSGFRMLESIPLLARFGYVRMTRFFNSWAEGLPARQAAEAEAFLASHRHLETARAESLAWENVCSETRCTRRLGDKPLAVISAGKDVLPGAFELQSELAALSTNSLHCVVKSADHVTLVTHREFALTVVEAIRRIVKR